MYILSVTNKTLNILPKQSQLTSSWRRQSLWGSFCIKWRRLRIPPSLPTLTHTGDRLHLGLLSQAAVAGGSHACWGPRPNVTGKMQIIKIHLSLRHSSTVSNQFGGEHEGVGNTKGHQRGSHSQLCSVSRLCNLGRFCAK